MVDANGNPLPDLAVGLVVNGSGNQSIGMTDSNGHISGMVPSNQAMTLSVYANYINCFTDNTIYTASIGPFTTDTVLPNITINNTGTTFSSNVMGNLVKCDNTNVTNGYIMLQRGGRFSFLPVINGTFSFNETYCSSNTQFELNGVDLDSSQGTNSITYNFTAPVTNVGNLQACNAINEFISYQIDSNPTVFFTQTTAGYTQNNLYVNGYNPVLQKSISISGNTIIPGTYTSMQFSIESTDIFINATNTTNTLQYNLNQVGAVGQYVDMTFGGTYQVSGVPHTITGTAHVIRD